MNASKALTHRDIEDFLVGFAAAVELDQIRVDALPFENFHPLYNDGMWRRYRSDHLVFISKLLKSVNEIPLGMLEELTRMTTAYQTAVVREAVVDLFSEAASGVCAEEEFESATAFFGSLIKDVSRSTPGRSNVGESRELMMQWLPATDPLRIAKDSECGYGPPVGFLN